MTRTENHVSGNRETATGPLDDKNQLVVPTSYPLNYLAKDTMYALLIGAKNRRASG